MPRDRAGRASAAARSSGGGGRACGQGFQLRRLCGPTPPQVAIDPACRDGIRASAALVKKATEGDAAVYGVNTGFGKLAMKRIAREDLATLQLKLLRSHAVGVGEPMSERVVRLILVLKATSLARGYSGVREEVVDALIALHNAGVIPVIPCQGSVGASGDLAPLAHLCLPPHWCRLGRTSLSRSGSRQVLKMINPQGLSMGWLSGIHCFICQELRINPCCKKRVRCWQVQVG